MFPPKNLAHKGLKSKLSDSKHLHMHIYAYIYQPKTVFSLLLHYYSERCISRSRIIHINIYLWNTLYVALASGNMIHCVAIRTMILRSFISIQRHFIKIFCVWNISQKGQGWNIFTLMTYIMQYISRKGGLEGIGIMVKKAFRLIPFKMWLIW